MVEDRGQGPTLKIIESLIYRLYKQMGYKYFYMIK